MLLLAGPIAAFGEYENYLTFIFLILLAIGADVGLFLLFKRTFCRVFLIGAEIVAILGWLFGLTAVSVVALFVIAIGVTAFFLANQNETRTFIANNMLGKGPKTPLFRRGRAKPESLFDREAMYQKIDNAVQILSRQKVGAIITFEKKDNLDELMKTGTKIDAPVTSELLQTIFYPGTRLHDGAVIIRDNKIAAASVYFVPTTRPLTGKFGSRHRAAIGVSEICDAVTVVVSEETGRISIAYQGELQTVSSDAFLSTFMDYMAMVKESAD